MLHLRANGYILTHVRNKRQHLVHLDEVQTVHFKHPRSGQLIAEKNRYRIWLAVSLVFIPCAELHYLAS